MRFKTFLSVITAGLAVLPVAPAGAASERPRVAARAAVGYDVTEKRFFFTQSADLPLPPASLVKMVTAIVAAAHLEPTDMVKISRAVATARSDTIRWPEGATFTVDQVMHGMLMQSSNGAATAIAELVSGSEQAFASEMNATAARLGARASKFVNPHGLDAPGQVSTARDLALIGAALLADPWLSAIVAAREYPVAWPDGTEVIFRTFVSFLLQYPDAIGVKTGFTGAAGQCLAGAATRGGRTLIAVALNDGQRNTDVARMLDHGFELGGPLPVAAAPDPSATTADLRTQAAAVHPAREPDSPTMLRLTLAAAIAAWAVLGARREGRRARQRKRGPVS